MKILLRIKRPCVVFNIMSDSGKLVCATDWKKLDLFHSMEIFRKYCRERLENFNFHSFVQLYTTEMYSMLQNYTRKLYQEIKLPYCRRGPVFPVTEVVQQLNLHAFLKTVMFADQFLILGSSQATQNAVGNSLYTKCE